MRKVCLCFLLVFVAGRLFAFFPFFYGARSLSLGYGSLAFNNDTNAIYLNPALLNYLASTVSGYQYSQSFRDYKNFGGRLDEVLSANVSQFTSLPAAERELLWSKLKELFGLKNGMFGFQANNPAFAGRGYGAALEVIDAAWIVPRSDNAVLSRTYDQVSDSDIASLHLHRVGLRYMDYALSLGIPLARWLDVGVTAHYLKGHVGETDLSLLDATFRPGRSVRDYLQEGWQDAQTHFSKLNWDFSLAASFGTYFKLGLAVRNAFAPVVHAPQDDLPIPRRIIAGLAFRPTAQWGFYIDGDLQKSDFFHNGTATQPFSLGVEKGFFQNKLQLRVGLWNDLREKYFLGRKSNALLGLGLGFRLGRLLVDLATGLDSQGHLRNLALSGFFILR